MARFPVGRSAPSRVAVALRTFTALVGGYAFAAALATLVARLLPTSKVNATAWALNLAFLFYAAVLLWSFAEHRLARVNLAVWGGAVLMFCALALLGRAT